MALIEVSETGVYVNHEYTPIPLTVTDGVSDVLFVPWYRCLYIQAVTAGLGSGDSLQLTLEGGLDGDGWDNLDTEVTTINTNRSTLIRYHAHT